MKIHIFITKIFTFGADIVGLALAEARVREVITYPGPLAWR